MRSATVCAAACFVAGCGGQIQRFTVQDAATVQAILDSLAADVRGAKWEEMGEHLSHDARIHAANGVILGRTAIVHWGKSLPNVEAFSFGPAEVHGDFGLAYGWSLVYVKFHDMPADTTRQLVVFRRGSDKRWSIQAVSVNTDIPLFPPGQTTKAASR